MNWNSRNTVGVVMSVALGFTVLSGCGKDDAEGASSTSPSASVKAPTTISVMLKSSQNDTATSESKIWKQVEQYTNTKLELLFTPDAAYSDKLNVTFASGSLPKVIFSTNSKLPTIINAVDGGAFWEIGPYLKDYPNLKQINPITLNNISINGKVYSLPTSRPLGRYGISYRKDWLDNVGLSQPKTVDDFYNMLKAFKEKDPDKNGKDDTYGMVVTKYNGSWETMQTWFGAPNKWGKDKDGKLVPAHLTTEYLDALKFFKKLYDEKLINQDFAVFDSAKWNDPVINGQAGVIVDTAERSYQIDEKIKASKLAGEISVIGSVAGKDGKMVLPALPGYGGVFFISKSAVKTESELKDVLNFFDKINDKDMQLLIQYGIEGTHYKVEDGKMVTLLTSDATQSAEINNKGINQLLLGWPDIVNTTFKAATPLRALAAEVRTANEKIIISNPAEPFVVPTYTQKGAQLDQMVEDARIKFIVGKIDEAGFKSEMELWKKSGGSDYVKEINDAYTASSK